MLLDTLIRCLDLTHAGGPAPVAVAVADLTDDSRQAAAGSLFIARQGLKDDGARYLSDAVGRGAAAVLLGRALHAQLTADLAALLAERRVCVLTCDDAQAQRQALASTLAERFFEHPSRALKLIAITGTNGKTTTALIVQHLLRTAGWPCGLIGTVLIDTGAPDGSGRRPAELTTPGAIAFSRLLREMVDAGCAACAAEVSSHALHQGRVAGLDIDVAVFTNLTGDHLDYHGTMDAYAAAKAILFDTLKPEGWSVINRDDPFAARMAQGPLQRDPGRLFWTTLTEPAPAAQPEQAGKTAKAHILRLAADHSRARFEGPWGSYEIAIPLVGRHNVCNALQALTAANCITPLARIARGAMSQCPPVPGRLEPVKPAAAPGSDPSAFHLPSSALPAVLVDYAHTHDALENVLLALRPVTKGQLIVLFGCGGDRDRTKRPKMAAVAVRLADRIIVTSDNPRTEDPDAIIGEILAGVPQNQRDKVSVEPDRAAAIGLALQGCQADDTVLLAGKGHEDYQIVRDPHSEGGTVKRHFDDREHAAAALRAWLQHHAVAAG
jgi:UDP-N-acetylmuramoyl-L-alanyl-D-glutamate--2,6-diaminopimelate ligase